MSEANNFGYGFMQPGDGGSRYNVLQFLIRQALAEVRTAIPVVVKAVTTAGGVSPIGTVDATPLVNILDGNANATKHIAIFGLPYFRLQGGANAVTMDPAVGDMGLAVVSDRDISAVKKALKQSPPGSGRRFDLADATYFGCTMSGSAPTQYVQFTPTGINIVSASGGINLNGTIIDKNGNLQLAGSIEAVGGGNYSGDIKTTGNIIANVGASQVTLLGHIHSANNTPPTPGH
jgi:hypothetical protein